MILKAKFRFNRPIDTSKDFIQPRMLLPLPYLEKSIRSIF